MIGGSINGGKILGSYPDDLTEASRLNIGKFSFHIYYPKEKFFTSIYTQPMH